MEELVEASSASQSGTDNEAFDTKSIVSLENAAEMTSGQRGETSHYGLNIVSIPFHLQTEGNKRSQRVAVVTVRNASKSYVSGKPILNNFNMTVEKGTIYGLLGASGCGKTTLLSCCVGLLRLNQGNIKVFGKESDQPPGKTVGYMPQDISLYNMFSIKEMLYYYGEIYNMSQEEISQRISFLIDFLKLPYAGRRVGTLSTGQQRRVSLAVAMIHDPPLLILDEPTVGVDALLRRSIWDHLVELVRGGRTTVIITTHYIEEAKQSNTVGLMRNGHLMAEDSPQSLLERFETTSLESVVLELCLVEETKKTEQDITYKSQRSDSKTQIQVAVNDDRVVEYQLKNENKKSQKNFEFMGLSFDRIKSLTTKNTKFMIRNYLFLMFVFLLPAIQVGIVCSIMGNDPQNLPFGIVNEEVLSKAECEGIVEFECRSKKLSCKFLRLLDDERFDMEYYRTIEDASRAVEDGKAWGYIHFPKNYSASLLPSKGQNRSRESSQLKVRLDESNTVIKRFIKAKLLDNFNDFISGILKDCGIDPSENKKPLEFGEAFYGEGVDFKVFLVLNMTVAVLFFFPVVTSGIQYIQDRSAGTLARSVVAGVKEIEIMISFVFTEGFVCAVQALLSLLVATLIYDIKVEGSIILAYILLVTPGICGISLGFLAAAICADAIQAVLLSIGMFLPNVMLSGLMWPHEGMTVVFKTISYCLPCTLASEALRSVTTRGWGLDHPHVYTGFISVFSWIVIYWTVNFLARRFSSKK